MNGMKLFIIFASLSVGISVAQYGMYDFFPAYLRSFAAGFNWGKPFFCLAISFCWLCIFGYSVAEQGKRSNL
jgi:hypothetical protein